MYSATTADLPMSGSDTVNQVKHRGYWSEEAIEEPSQVGQWSSDPKNNCCFSIMIDTKQTGKFLGWIYIFWHCRGNHIRHFDAITAQFLFMVLLILTTKQPLSWLFHPNSWVHPTRIFFKKTHLESYTLRRTTLSSFRDLGLDFWSMWRNLTVKSVDPRVLSMYPQDVLVWIGWQWD
jgi:hypothetical protein